MLKLWDLFRPDALTYKDFQPRRDVKKDGNPRVGRAWVEYSILVPAGYQNVMVAAEDGQSYFATVIPNNVVLVVREKPA